MPADMRVQRTTGENPQASGPRPPDCLIIIFGASGDLTKRLLMPAFYNLACDGLLPEHFAIVGVALDNLSTEQFRDRLTAEIKQFNTRSTFNDAIWEKFASRLYYTPGNFGDLATYQRLDELVAKVETEQQTGGNRIFYLATPPAVFGLIADKIFEAGFKKDPKGWIRLVVEKPFGRDLASAEALNRVLLAHWTESEIYRMDHYLGKETVQNLLAFRFSNGIYEPLWNKNYVNHIQFTVSETVGVEGRGGYYDQAGVLRDMMQNHMLQMLAYVCMEPPISFRADAVRDEKAKLLEAVRILSADDVAQFAVRGQYGPGKKADGSPAAGYREEPNVNPQSSTETFAAVRLLIDNWRWEGVPIYLRSGKSLWKRGTEIIVEFKKAPEVVFRDSPAVGRLEANRLLFHIQPDQSIEFRFHAKTPGPAMALQKVNMRFEYSDSFEASRGTGYEVLLHNLMTGDATLFSRTDLVESAWRIAQPLLDAWESTPATDFPNYPAGSWGPRTAFDLIERDGRQWVEVINRESLATVPLFKGANPVLLQNLAMMLKPVVYSPGDLIVRVGDVSRDMYVIVRGQVEVVDGSGNVIGSLGEGEYFGELSLLHSQKRTASIRAVTPCNLFVLEGADFNRVVKAFPEVITVLEEAAKTRYPGLD